MFLFLLQMSMEERLNAISVDHPSHPTREPPQADTLARLLTQGLQSQDKKLINVSFLELELLNKGLLRPGMQCNPGEKEI